jgi:hypothetical protein
MAKTPFRRPATFAAIATYLLTPTPRPREGFLLSRHKFFN